MKTAWGIVIILLLLGWGLAFFFYDAGKNQELGNAAKDSARLAEIAHLKANVATRDAFVLETLQKMQSDSLNFRVAQNASKDEIKAMRKRLHVERGADTVTVTLTDSIFMADDTLIASLESERDAIRKDCHQLTDSLLANATDLKSIIGIKDVQIVGLQKDLSREQRKVKIFKWLAIIGVGLAIEESIR